MRRTFRRHFRKQKPMFAYWINEQIRVPQLRVIDENGVHLGVLDTTHALSLARERGLDLVLISPKENPAVAKILDYRQFQYEKAKEERKQKLHSKKVETKGIRLSLRISQHDLGIRLIRAKDFLEEGNKVKLEMVLRGRELTHLTLAKELVNKFLDSLREQVSLEIEEPLKRQGGRLMVIVYKKK